MYLDEAIRNKLNIKLDHKSEIFQNLNGASADVKLVYNEASGEYFVKNIVTETTPSLIHGNGPSKVLLNNFGCYVAGAYRHNECHLCTEQILEEFDLNNEDALPTVTVALFITKATPFLEEFFDSIRSLEYPKQKLTIFVYNNVSRNVGRQTKINYENLIFCFD